MRKDEFKKELGEFTELVLNLGWYECINDIGTNAKKKADVDVSLLKVTEFLKYFMSRLDVDITDEEIRKLLDQ